MTEVEGYTEIPTPSEEDLKPTVRYMDRLILAHRIIKMWPNVYKMNPYLHLLLVFVITTWCVTYVLSLSIQVAKDFQNLDSIAVIVDLLTVFASGTFRYLYIHARRKKYLRLVSLIHNNFIQYSLFPSKTRGSLMKHYKRANKLILAYNAFTLFWVFQICTLPLFHYMRKTWNLSLDLNETQIEPVKLPVILKTYAPFDYYKQPANALFYIHQSVGFVLFAWIYIIVDSFWYMVIFLTIGQFDLIKESVNAIVENLKKEETANELQLLNKNQIQNVGDALKHCIRHHQFTREFVRLLDEINNPNILIDSLHAVISICFILLDTVVALNSKDWGRVMYSSEYFISSVTHFLLFDWLANQLATTEEELADIVYDIPWHKCPAQKHKIMLMSTQARRPCKLTGGKMYTVSLEFFASMLKAIFSYFTFLLKLRN